MSKKKILVTGSAGFIGFHVFRTLQALGYDVVGIDNLNSYYDVNLKLGRLKISGFDVDQITPDNVCCNSDGGRFYLASLEDQGRISEIFNTEHFDIVCNFAAQAGVRYSMIKPFSYIDSNVSGFLSLLECCRNCNVEHLIYASSSSIYGNAKKVPFSINDQTDSPISLYAATKKSNELMAYCYNHLFGFSATGLRFFTVYGPWGRPDMALFKFTKAILSDQPIEVFNHGNLSRDFTYVDDIVSGIVKIIEKSQPGSKHKIYNIGRGCPVQLMDFIHAIEDATGRKAILEMKEMQLGDVDTTWADTSNLQHDFNYTPQTSITDGVGKFVEWYRNYYKR